MEQKFDFLNKIILADACDFIKNMPDKCVDLILTDPPFNISTKGAAGKNKPWKGFIEIKKYSSLEVNFFTKEIFTEYERICKGKFNCFVFCGKNDLPVIFDFLNTRKYCWNLLPLIKINPIPLIRHRDWLSNEFAVHISDGAVLASVDYKNKIPYFEMVCKQNNHPNQKPIEIIQRILRNISRPGDIVFDPFIGSGTTGIAAISLGRQFIGCEINPQYYALATNRINDFNNNLFAYKGGKNE